MAISNRTSEIVWDGNVARLRKHRITIVPDERYPTMWRIKYPNGRLSDMVNRTRAKDAANVFLAARDRSGSP